MTTVNYIAVDDEPIYLKQIEENLQTYPFLTKLALLSDPFEALDFIINKQPDVIFLDYEMPGISGKDILRKLDYEAQVIFITSHFSPIQDIINHDGPAIIQGYLSKPINKKVLKKICLKLIPTKEIQKSTRDKIILNDGIRNQFFISKHKLSYVSSEGKYTNWHFIDSAPIKGLKILLKEAEDILITNNVSHIRVNKSNLVCDNGIVQRNTNDIITHSFGSKNNLVEIAISDSSKFKKWVSNVFR
ncbi:DNA-binding response regulator, LytR/AlgR family [Saccharicrinis carchari]|uniref:DNA-binding response regulator, LytR/AlgR family n=1 Tax=Saccharicrinis carchari TaxID=1168039 RepID=A0A521AY72_SACCC|nr:response regulator [Saccharicrinis carchari]SMO39788.1 DNA-binding response regulator, LytR/AlgR family [Saccharicrinis carchari]